MRSKLEEKRALQKRMRNRQKQIKKREEANKPIMLRILKKVPIIMLIFIIVSFSLYGVVSLYVKSKIFCKYNISQTTKNSYEGIDKYFLEKENIENIILITCYGDIENRNTKINSLSILTIDNNSNKVKRTELNGELLLNIPGIGENKLSSAMKMGGKDFLIDTVKYNFNLEISKYIAINLNEIEDSDMNKFEKYIENINKKSILSNYKFLKASLNYITTNIKLYEGVKIVSNIFKIENMSIETLSLPIGEITTSIIYKELGQVAITDLEQSKNILHSFIYDDKEFNIENLDLYSAKLVLDKYILEQQVYNDLYGL